MCLAYSMGGGRERGTQLCDAIGICEYGCPEGMTKVAPPERSDTYTLRTADGSDVGGDPAQYVPGDLLPLYLRVTKRTIMGKGWCTQSIKFGGVVELDERCTTGNESAKYIGLLLYAVRTGDADETKVGEWAIPLQEPTKFWAPPDQPGCDQKALMHRYAEPKHYLERFVFRAPPAGTGSITFRALLKQGDTNMGAFYWPSAPAQGLSASLTPSAGRSGGDLVLDEAESAAHTWSFRGAPGEACTAVCSAEGLTCDEQQLLGATSAAALDAAVEPSFLCAKPHLRTCSDAAPHMSGYGDGLCFYRDLDEAEGGTCPTRSTSTAACDAPSSDSLDDGLRLCPCVDPSGRRLARADAAAGGAGASDDALPGAAESYVDSVVGSVASNGSRHAKAPPPEHAAAPCDESPAEPLPHKGHGAGGNPLRCPNQRARHAASRRASGMDVPEEAATANVAAMAADLAAKTPPGWLWPSSSAPLGGGFALAAGLALVAARPS